ncbi:MAG: stage II sporulation protein E [Bacillota bacterium]|jgi:stage II sporulation protein E
MLNKARIDSPAFGQYEPLQGRLARQVWRARYQAFLGAVTDATNLRLVLIGLLLGRAVLFGELAPFALAFFITVRWCCPERSLLAALATTSGALLRSPGAAVSLMGSLGIYISLERFLFGGKRRTAAWSIALASLSCLLVKFPVFLIQSPSLFDLISTLLEAGLVAVLIYVLNQSTRLLLTDEPMRFTAEQGLAICVAMGAMLLGLDGWAVMGLSLKRLAAAYFVMVAAYVGGPGLGSASGATIGAVLNMASPALLGQVGLYAFAGLLAGLFRDMRKVGVAASFTVALLLLTVYGSQPGDLRLIAYQSLLASGLFLASGRRWLDYLRPHLQMPLATVAEVADGNAARLQQVLMSRLRELEVVFDQLATTFAENDDDEGFLVEKNFNALMDHVVTDVCENCSHFNRCWQQSFYKSYHTMLNMLALADAQGELSSQRIPEQVRQHCSKAEQLITCANYLVKVYKVNLYWQKQMRASRSLVANQLKGVSDIMRSLGREMRLDVDFEADLAEEIKEEIGKLKLFVPQVEVYRRADRVDVILSKPRCQPDESQCSEQLIPLVSALVGRPVTRLQARCPGRSGKGKCNLCLSTSQALDIETGIAQMTRPGCGVSGDTVSVKELPRGKLAVMLSDGMGNGPEASRESRATVAILDALLRAGFNQETAVQTINSVLMLRSTRETFATVDLAVLDLYTGIAELTKIGATAAFIKRGDQVEYIGSSSLPAGILHKIDIESNRINLQPGDVLIMLTDGLLDSQKDVADKEEWFTRVLQQCDHDDPQEMARYLIERASMNARNQVLDDMTVVTVRVNKPTTSIPLVS